MARGDFCTKSTSSVHLRDLDKLVSSFNEERRAVDMKNRKLVSGDYPTRDRIEYMSVGTLSSRDEQEVASFEERFDGTVIEGAIKNEVAFDSTLESESDPGIDIQYSKNSLNLISELCDRLITASLPNNSKHCVSQPSWNETWATPIANATRKLEPAYDQTMLSPERDGPAKGSSCSRGYSTQNTATLQVSPLMIKTNVAMNKSNDGITAPLGIELSKTEADKEAENSSNKQIGDYADQMPLDSCPQPIAAISRMQQMLERISPALGRGTITNQRTAEDRDCVSSDDSLQSTSACEIAVGSSSATPASVQSSVAPSQNSPGKYSELLAVIEELGKDIRPTYAGSKNAAERLKKGIMHARVLVRECLVETDRCARQ